MIEGKLRNRQEGIRKIDVDIVPGLLIQLDTVPHPSDSRLGVDCPVYAVIKLVSKNDVPHPHIVWRMCSSGYEKHTLDMAQFDQKKRYIVTALRILKTYFTTTKTRAQANNQPPPQITTVLRSYFLKHIAFYLILYLCYIYPDVSIEGVEDVLAYFLSFLSVVLEKRCLPHFFHSNDLIRWMYPSYPVIRNKLYFNLLRNKSPDSLLQARRALKFDMIPKVGVSPRSSPIVDEFRDMISGLELF